jgi:DNA adenine methylase
MATLTQNRLMPWFGANTANAAAVGKLLAGAAWVGIPFAGGMSEVPEIKASTIVINDKHSHVINLCHVLRDDDFRAQLIRKLDASPFHPVELAQAQDDSQMYDEAFHGLGCVHHARAYFISQWMGRSGKAGTKDEFSGNLSTRTNANGGDSAKRFRSAVESLDEWSAVMRRCNFSCLDFREWFETFDGDTSNHGYYCDPPWVEEGKKYRFPFVEQDHSDLATRLRRFENAKVVVRYGDHPLVRELYDGWEFITAPTRNQGNNAVDEVLIVRR